MLAEGASAAVARFCTQHGVPLVTTYKAKGVLEEAHPLALGGAGLSPLADGTLLPLVAQADLVLCLGYDPIEMRSGWRHPWDPAETRAIEISHLRNDHGMHAAGIEIVGGIAPSLAALSRDLTPRRIPHPRAAGRRTSGPGIGNRTAAQPAAAAPEAPSQPRTMSRSAGALRMSSSVKLPSSVGAKFARAWAPMAIRSGSEAWRAWRKAVGTASATGSGFGRAAGRTSSCHQTSIRARASARNGASAALSPQLARAGPARARRRRLRAGLP